MPPHDVGHHFGENIADFKQHEPRFDAPSSVLAETNALSLFMLLGGHSRRTKSTHGPVALGAGSS